MTGVECAGLLCETSSIPSQWIGQTAFGNNPGTICFRTFGLNRILSFLSVNALGNDYPSRCGHNIHIEQVRLTARL
jgi:hypothetical protein